jgi:N-formylglutamate deformylase
MTGRLADVPAPLVKVIVMTPLLVHLPHDSTLIPPDERADFLLPDDELARESLRLTDAHTADLYAEGCPSDDFLRAPVSRLVVDVERFADDDREPCARIGMGATYVRTCEGRPLRALTPARREELMRRYYWPHHHALEAAATERLARFGRCVILDAHSYPTGPLPTQSAFGRSPEIGIGTEAMHTPPELCRWAEDFFRVRGFDVGLDTPFSGAMVPGRYFGHDPRVQSLMIEVRRDLYMDEATGERHEGFDWMRRSLTDFRKALVVRSAALGPE